MDQNSYMKNREKVEKPWGSFERFTLNEPSTVKIIFLKKGQALSLQKHHNRAEFWKVMKGDPILTIGDETLSANLGGEFFIPPDTLHRQTGGQEDAEILEISFGNFDEKDITRLGDKYGRAGTSN